MEVLICSRIYLHGLFVQVACFFDKGDKYRRTSIQASSQLRGFGEERIREQVSGFYSPCIFPEKDLCSLMRV